MRESIQCDNFKAIKLFKSTIARVEEDAVLEPVKVKEVSQIIKKLKNSNARGDSEVTNRILKCIHNYMALALTHLSNNIFRTEIFPDTLKCSPILPLQKSGKPPYYMNS